MTNPVRDATTPTQRVVDAERTRRGTTEPTKCPGPSAVLDHRRAFTAGDVMRVLDSAISTQERRDDDRVDLLAFLDGTGVRVGAALATLWTNIDLDGDGWTAGTDLDPRHAWIETGEFTITRVTGAGLVRSAYGQRNAAFAGWHFRQSSRTGSESDVVQPDTEYVFPDSLQFDQPREVSFVTKRLRRLFDTTVGEDGVLLTWASSHSFRRTLVTDARDAGTPDHHIAGQGGWSRIHVLQGRYIARMKISTLGTDLRNRSPRVTPVGRGESDSESDFQVK